MSSSISNIRDAGFFSASRARELASYGSATNTSSIVFRELAFLRDAIATAVAQGNLSVTVSTSPMSSDTTFFNAWSDPENNNTEDDKKRRIWMQEVIDYFSFMGYNIRRIRVGTTDFFEWSISW